MALGFAEATAHRIDEGADQIGQKCPFPGGDIALRRHTGFQDDIGIQLAELFAANWQRVCSNSVLLPAPG